MFIQIVANTSLSVNVCILKEYDIKRAMLINNNKYNNNKTNKL